MDSPSESGTNQKNGSPDQYAPLDDKQQLILEGGTSQGSEVSPLQMESEGKSQTPEGLKVIVISSIVFAIAVTVALIATIYFGPPQVPPVGAVASDIKVCSDIGARMMEELDGGAVDGAVATAFCLGVVNGHTSGIGGGGFMVIRDNAKKAVEVFNFREQAPQAASVDMFTTDKASIIGSLSVAIPGEVRGLESVHEKYGLLKWKDVIQPSIDLANEGFVVSKSLDTAIQANLDKIRASEGLKRIYFNGNTPIKGGETLKRPDLAKTLQLIADEGAAAFYTGELAKQIVSTMVNTGGLINAQDLEDYTVLVEKPLITTTTVHNITIEAPQAPAAGPLVLNAINILESYGLGKDNQSDPQYYHRLAEALKFAYAQKGFLGDPAVEPDVDNRTSKIIDKQFAETLASYITNVTHPTNYYLDKVGNPPLGPDNTGGTHFSVIGPDEYMVSVSTSINSAFGSGIVVNHTGIILNNHMDDFDKNTPENKNSYNLIAPGKRPQSNMAPLIVHSGRRPCGLRSAVGGENGTSIISGNVGVVVNMVAFGMSLEESIEEPRLHSNLPRNIVFFQQNFNASILADLKSRGHELELNDQGINFVNAVMKKNETVAGHSDDGKEGFNTKENQATVFDPNAEN